MLGISWPSCELNHSVSNTIHCGHFSSSSRVAGRGFTPATGWRKWLMQGGECREEIIASYANYLI